VESEIKAIILAIITTTISLFALYYPEYRILIISLASITFVGYILFLYLNKIEEHESQIKELRKSFKRAEELIKLRADIESLKRRIR